MPVQDADGVTTASYSAKVREKRSTSGMVSVKSLPEP
ncbi:hypothetical protein SAMN05442782_0923 [Streptomyces sp. OK228]|nr:hypothetical protein SAMN05442782_0923 [Streptomyces sp. OK228]